MFRWIIFGALVVAATVGLTVGVSYLPDGVERPEETVREKLKTQGPPPKLTVVEPSLEHDFGAMADDKTGGATWNVKNEGQGELKLTLLETTCGCTSVQYMDGDAIKNWDRGIVRTVAPGETAKVLVNWSTAGKSGRFSTMARFSTNDFEEKPALELAITGRVIPHTMIFPDTIQFVDAPTTSSSSQKIYLVSTQFSNFEVSNISSGRPEFLNPTVQLASEDDKQQLLADLNGVPIAQMLVIDLELKPGMPIGTFRDELIVKTNHPDRPEMRISLSGRVTGPISSSPESILLANVSSKKGATRELTLTVLGHDDTTFELDREGTSETVRDALELAFEPMPQPASGKLRQYRMTLTIAPDKLKPGALNGSIVLKTSHPQVKEMKIPIRGFITSTAG